MTSTLLKISVGALGLLLIFCPISALDKKRLMKKWGYHEPRIEQVLAVRQAQKECNIGAPLHVALYPDETQAQTVTLLDGESLMAVAETPDKDLIRAIVYHELGHVYREDSALIHLTQTGKIPLNQILNSNDAKKLKQHIAAYVTSALNAFNDTSATGRCIKKIIELKGEQNIRASIDYLCQARSLAALQEIAEYRADLFGVSQLAKKGYFDSILALLSDLLKLDLTNDIVDPAAIQEVDDDTFAIQRILIIAGYLTQNGYDINNLLSQWEKIGRCTYMRL